MAVLDYDSITERLYKDYMDDPEQLLRDSLNGDMGGRLSILLHGYTTEITPIEYEIIVLKTYNKVLIEWYVEIKEVWDVLKQTVMV